MKVALIVHFDGKCKLCTDQEETQLIFFVLVFFFVGCWMVLTRVLSNLASWLSLVSASFFLNILDNCLHTSPTHTICLSVLFETTWHIWKQRNEDTYERKRQSFIPIIPLTKALHLLNATLSVSKGILERRRIQETIQGLHASNC